MTMISDERLHEIAGLQPPTERDARQMAQELLTARSYIPRLQQDLVDAGELHLADETTIRQLEQTARGYAEQQAKMIDMRQANAEQIQRLMHDITEGAARELRDAQEIWELKAALRAIRDELRCLTAVRLSAPEQK